MPRDPLGPSVAGCPVRAGMKPPPDQVCAFQGWAEGPERCSLAGRSLTLPDQPARGSSLSPARLGGECCVSQDPKGIIARRILEANWPD